MGNDLSILQSKSPLTKYEEGVVFTLQTFGSTYEIDPATAQKLSDLLLSPGETKFVKIRTKHGQVVLNTSAIKEIIVDEHAMDLLMEFIAAQPAVIAEQKEVSLEKVFELAEEKIDWCYMSYRSYRRPFNAEGNDRFSREIFEKYWRREATKYLKGKA